MDSEFNAYSIEEDFQENEILLGASGRFVFSKKRIFGRMHFLKRPADEYRNDLITIESLRKEFAIGYALDHPNIAKYFRFENDTLIEEYIDGKSLRELIEVDDARLRNKQFLQNLCRQLLDALLYLRDKGVVHNDIKPENVIITRIGNAVKLVDFNCAQSSDNDILGGFTHPYKAPEQGTVAFDTSSDLYQVGKMMEELCARGGNKSWKRFIVGATADNPDKRISLETAEKLIPSRHTPKRLVWALLPLIILGVVAVIIFTPIPTETDAVKVDTTVKDTMMIEHFREPAEETVVEKGAIRPADTKKIIETKISDYTDTYYQTHIYPVCREVLENRDRRLTAEEEAELQRAIGDAYRSAGDYGEKLASEYPLERTYIEKESLNCMEMKISALLLKLYPPGGAHALDAEE